MDQDAQWIILMGFIISVGIFFLAVLLNQSILVGQTTADSVLEFPKSSIQDLRSEVYTLHIRYENLAADNPISKLGYDNHISKNRSIEDIKVISMQVKSEYVRIAQIPGKNPGEVNISRIHYNNGITEYDENITYSWNY